MNSVRCAACHCKLLKELESYEKFPPLQPPKTYNLSSSLAEVKKSLKRGQRLFLSCHRRPEASGSWAMESHVFVDDVLIAKRGHAGMQEAGSSISLEPGWSVVAFGETELTVMFDFVRIH